RGTVLTVTIVMMRGSSFPLDGTFFPPLENMLKSSSSESFWLWGWISCMVWWRKGTSSKEDKYGTGDRAGEGRPVGAGVVFHFHTEPVGAGMGVCASQFCPLALCH